ncbi:MAG: glycosyltransferase [Selenomonadaceae bacterium]|nr:glycosyltransferase [Selenomonadaceae bacterium]
MVIVELSGGLGNQVYEYCLGKYFSCQLNTELKIDLTSFKGKQKSNSRHTHMFYELKDFNIEENYATPEEIKRVKENGLIFSSSSWPNLNKFLESKGDIFLSGFLGGEKYIDSVMSVLKKEFTLKNPLSLCAEKYKKKILSAEYSVSMHFRYGDYAYHPGLDGNGKRPWFKCTPISYCQNAIEVLKKLYSNLTVFVFSDNIQFIKENLRLDVQIEFIEGCKSATEELVLMSLCKCNISPGSSFSKTAMLLNPNPDKIFIHPMYTTDEEVSKYFNSLTTPIPKPSVFCRNTIFVPANFNEQKKISLRPFFSLLLVVNNDAATIVETLNSILNQDYKYYEVIIIDNASTDGSGKICQQAIKGKENVIFRKLWTKVKNAKAWNMALKMIRGGGYYISFLKGNDRFLSNTLTKLYLVNASYHLDIVHCFNYLKENENGNVFFCDKKCTDQRDAKFITTKNVVWSQDGQEAIKLLLNQQINRFLGTKIYHNGFLSDNKIKFDEHLDDDLSEVYFQMKCFLKSKYFMYVPNAVYVAPNPNISCR